MKVYKDGELVDASADEQALLEQEFASRGTPANIKAEVSRRINAVLKDTITQVNMTAYGTALTRAEAAGTITPDQSNHLSILNAAQAWVLSVQAKGRELVANADPTYDSDEHWPPAPAGVVALVAVL